MDVKIEFEGLDQLKAAVSNPGGMDPIKKIVRHHGNQLEKRMKDNAIFVKGYSHGDTREGIHLILSPDGMTATVEPRTSYSPYLEWGTRYMSAQPFVGPSWREQKNLFLADLQKLVR